MPHLYVITTTTNKKPLRSELAKHRRGRAN